MSERVGNVRVLIGAKKNPALNHERELRAAYAALCCILNTLAVTPGLQGFDERQQD